MVKEVRFEWYVLNENFNRNQEITPFNIFNNIHVHEATNKLCRDYKTHNMTFEDFTEQLRRILQWQEWARCEYEIVVAPLIVKDENDRNWKKIDCYQQALPNIKLIAKYVLEEYYPKLKINLPKAKEIEVESEEIE
jgi:hypothetical protein